MKKVIMIILLLFFVFAIEKVEAAIKFRGFTGTTGGATGDLDAFSCLTPEDGDLAIVKDSSEIISYYIWDDTESAGEVDPIYIIPDDRVANCSSLGRWEMFSGFNWSGITKLYNASGEYATMQLGATGYLNVKAPDGSAAGGGISYYVYDPAPYFTIYPESLGGGLRIADPTATYYNSIYTHTNGDLVFNSTGQIAVNLPSSGHMYITPGSNGYGLLLYDVGASNYVTLYVEDNTDRLALNGDFSVSGDFRVYGNYTLGLTENYVLVGNSNNEAEAVNSISATIEVATANRALISDGSKVISESDVTSTELAYLDGSTENVQNAIDRIEEEEKTFNATTDATFANKRSMFTTATTTTLAAAGAAGFNYGGCVFFFVRDAAEAAVIDVQAGEKINLDGTALSVGTAITSTGAGEYVTMCPTTDTDGLGTDGFIALGATSGWASE
jgi:hypothetical protein